MSSRRKEGTVGQEDGRGAGGELVSMWSFYGALGTYRIDIIYWMELERDTMTFHQLISKWTFDHRSLDFLECQERISGTPTVL